MTDHFSRAVRAATPRSRLSPGFDRLRIRHLRLLELIAQRGSLTGAAEALHLSQPSATKMLQELEHACGCALVARNVRGGTLSTAGRHALERLRVALGSLEAARLALHDQPERPLLRVGAFPLAGVALIPRAVAWLAARGTLPRLTLHEDIIPALIDMLCDGQVDCVIGRVSDLESHGARRFDVLPLHDEGFEIACAPDHPLARERRLTLARMRDQPWIAVPHGTYTRQVFDAAFTSAGLVPPVPEMESPSFHTNLATAARTRMLTFAPRSAVRLYVENRRVQRVALAQPFPTDYSAFLTLRDVPAVPAVLLLREALTEIIREGDTPAPVIG